MRRRTFIQAAAAGSALLLAGCQDSEATAPSTKASGATAAPTTSGRASAAWTMPDEGERHTRTWMAFGASKAIWGGDLLPQVQRDLATIAITIARFEPVSMLVRSEDLAVAKRLIGAAKVELVPAPIDDLWMRDTGPVFVTDGRAKAGVDFNFNGWGRKQEHARDAKVAGFVAARAQVAAHRTDLVLEGGGIEVDGQGTAIITESCVLNKNRNPDWTKAEVEDELFDRLGIERVIWLPGIAGRDITDGHTDFYARFTSPGVVVAGLDNDPDSFDYAVTRKHLTILRSATDARGRRVKVEVLPGPSTIRDTFPADDFAAGYINFYACNGAVIAPQFGDAKTDASTKATLQRLFPGREVVQLNIDAVAAGGGGIHCTTQQEPAI